MPQDADWSPDLYTRFEAERTRPARDLLAAVPLTHAARVVDMGCGPGNSTELLAQRFPGAEITGLDTSPAMLEQARARLPACRFELADASDWRPGADVDLVFANAVYHWLPDHIAVLPQVLSALQPGGAIAVQMPDNVDQPSHQLMQRAAEAGPWRERLAGASRARLATPCAYYDALRPVAARVDVWRTVYHHMLPGPEAIVDLFASTGLRPYLAPLSPEEQAAFLADYAARLTEAYPRQADGAVLFPFPRFFIVAQR